MHRNNFQKLIWKGLDQMLRDLLRNCYPPAKEIIIKHSAMHQR